jgi:hypothetical protein
MFQKKPVAVAVAAAVGLVSAGPIQADESLSAGAWTRVQSVEFIGMDAPDTPAERVSTYTEAQVKVTHRNGKSQTFPLSYNVLHYNTTTIDGVTAGALYDVNEETLKDVNGKPHISESPDANSLIEVSRWDNYQRDKNDNDDSYGDRNHKRLFLVTHCDTTGSTRRGTINTVSSR